MVPEILRDNGYATAMFGKWHNTPETEISPAGPFDRWPTGLGFDYFYGFNQGETNQYYPTLYRNTDAGRRAEDARAGLPLHRGHDRRGDRLDRATSAPPTRTSRGSCYFSTGAAPRPAPRPEGVARQVHGQVRPRLGQAARDDATRKQKRWASSRADTKLTPRPKEIPAWDDQPADAKKVYTPADGELRRATWPTPTTSRPADRQPASSPASSTTRWSSTSSATTAPAPRAGWRARSTRSPA